MNHEMIYSTIPRADWLQQSSITKAVKSKTASYVFKNKKKHTHLKCLAIVRATH